MLVALRESGFDPANPPAKAARLHLMTPAETVEPVPAHRTRKTRAGAGRYGQQATGRSCGAEAGRREACWLQAGATRRPAAETSAAETVETAEIEAARRAVAVWPTLLLALPAGVAIWGGWVGLGELTGFGEVNLLRGIVADGKLYRIPFA